MNTTRELALRILCQIEYEGAYPNLALSKALADSAFEERDRAFVSELVYGVLRHQTTLDYAIKNYSSVRLKKIAPRILILLRMSAFQLLVLNLPVHAVCHETVELAKKVGHAGSVRFVNAMVRRMAKDGMPPLPTEHYEALSVSYSFPLWLIHKFAADFGDDALEPLLNAFQRIPVLTVRTNRLKTTPSELSEKLSEEGVTVTPGRYHKDALQLSNTGGIARLTTYEDGLFIVQDEGAMMIVPVLDPKEGERIWDVCAAPGGKTTQIAELCGDKADVLATDAHAHKIELIEAARRRLGITCIRTAIQDATLPLENPEYFDRVLVDAPCSGLGILGRKTDIRWMKNETDLKALSEIQLSILQQVCRNVKQDGVLVYSTCTINPEENDGVIDAFLDHHPEFELEDVNPYLPEKLRSAGKTLTLLPHIHGCDGFYIARMRRVKV